MSTIDSDDRIPDDIDQAPNAALAAITADFRAATDAGLPAPKRSADDDFAALLACLPPLGEAPEVAHERDADSEEPTRLQQAPAEPRVLPFRSRRGTRIGLVVAGMAAAAAAFFLVAGKKPTEKPLAVLPPVYAPVGNVAPHVGEGLLISGGRAVASAPLREGSTLATKTRASFVRPGKVRWLLEGIGPSEPAADATVLEGRDALRVALERGAIEAEVTPVPHGEAFSVDVAGTRVAVHGTHLRVARIGDTITIDLSHGVIALGLPGKSRVDGAEIVAPAHIEFPVGHPEQKTVRTTDLRAPELFDDAGDVVTAPLDEPLPVTLATVKEARKTLVDAVDVCTRRGHTSSDAVQITVSSTATLSFADGKIHGTRFSPPLRPDLQACVAARMNGMAVDASAPILVPVRFTLR